jgi:tetratricopeptide (TPR) repeat protein
MIDTQSREQALERVRILYDLRRFDEGSALARRTVATAPDYADAWCLLAQGLLAMDDDEAALDAARRGAAIAPEDEWPHRLRSLALSALDRNQEALSAACESVHCAPSRWQTHARVATTSASLNLAEQAEAAAARAIELNPNECGAWCTAAKVASVRGDKDLAADRYRQALRLDPQSSQAHAGLAGVHLTRRGPNSIGLAAAASGFATSVRTDPHDPLGRSTVEVVLRVFLARSALFIYVACYLMFRFSAHWNNGIARFTPVFVLVAPAIFVARFLAHLSRDVRAHFLRTIRRGVVAIGAVAALLAAAIVIVGAFLAESSRRPAAVVALVCGLCARLVLFLDLRHKFPQLVEPLARWRGVLWVVVGGLGLAGCLLLAAGYRTPGGIGAGIAGVIALAIGGGLAVLLRRVRP